MIKIDTGDSLTLGYRGEHLARCCELEIPEDWLTEFGESGDIEIHVIRPSETQAYKAAEVETDITARKAVWTITSVETSFAGSGKAQLCYIINGVVVKSKIFSTYIRESNSAAEPVDPPPPSVIEDAVEQYLEQFVDVVTVRSHGTEGDLLKSNGDGSYSWLTPADPLIDTDEGEALVPVRSLHRLANAVRQKTGYEGDLDVDTMAQVLEETDLWSTDEFALGLAPAGEITLLLGALPANSLQGRNNIGKVNLPYCGRIGSYAFRESSVSIVDAPELATLDQYVFYNCTALSMVNFPKLTNIRETGCFNGCWALAEADFPSLKSISGGAFSACHSLARVNLPELTNTYGNSTAIDGVFNTCRVIERIELPKFEGVMRSTWFDACYNLKELILPKVTSFSGNNNFRNCYALEKLYAPECKVWAANNFSGCNSLKRLCIYTKPTTITTTSFNAPALEDIYVPWAQGEVANAPWGAPAGCRVHYNTQYDEHGEPIE